MLNRARLSNPCSKPRGWRGRFVLWLMNLSHSRVTDWGLRHVAIGTFFTILDVGCGGGRTLGKLAALATDGKVVGVDYSEQSIAASRRTNADWILRGRVELCHAAVSQLPFPENEFDLITAVETHFWWPNLPGDLRELHRTLKPGGTLVLIAEIYKGANAVSSKLAEKASAISGITLLNEAELREVLTNAGYTEIVITAERKKGWICAVGRKPATASADGDFAKT